MPITDFKEDPYLSLLRPLVQAYLAFYRTGSRHIESMGLTPSQFDVIAELGDTEGLTCADLSEATLVTKGTLTGVLDRLEAKGIVKRENIERDRRAIKVRLTNKGQKLFRKVFPAHAEFLRPYFKEALRAAEVQHLKSTLDRLRQSFEKRESHLSGNSKPKSLSPKLPEKKTMRRSQFKGPSEKAKPYPGSSKGKTS